MMEPRKLAWKIGGEAGYGIMTSGLTLSRCFARGGYHIFDTTEYPSLIRGGHNTYTVRIEDEPIAAPVHPLNILVALDAPTVRLHQDEVLPGGAILYDPQRDTPPQGLPRRTDINWYAVPFQQIARDLRAPSVMRNTVALGATLGLVQYDFVILDELFAEVFGKKGEGVSRVNTACAKAGYDYAVAHYAAGFGHEMPVLDRARKSMVIAGAEAMGMGAIAAGCKFFGGYPMSPSTSLLHYLAKNERRYGMIVKHCEDEIAAICMAIGAAVAGVRAMTGTSGGGFSLMTEALGLAGMTETPLVIAEVQRAGPSTGMPTKTGQEDLRFLLHASQGEFPRVILAPGDQAECFELTRLAFNLAERYQLPVFVVSDRYLSDAHATLPPFSAPFQVGHGPYDTDAASHQRYRLTADGVSPRMIPGTPGLRQTTVGNEHDEAGDITEDGRVRAAMMDKRFRKMAHLAKEIQQPTLFGPADTAMTIISWGSTKGAVREAMKFLARDGVRVNHLHLWCLSPFPTEAVCAALTGRTLLIEHNKTGQLRGLIREHCLRDVDYALLHYTGEQIYPEQVCDEVRRLVRIAEVPHAC